MPHTAKIQFKEVFQLIFLKFAIYAHAERDRPSIFANFVKYWAVTGRYKYRWVFHFHSIADQKEKNKPPKTQSNTLEIIINVKFQ